MPTRIQEPATESRVKIILALIMGYTLGFLMAFPYIATGQVLLYLAPVVILFLAAITLTVRARRKEARA